VLTRYYSADSEYQAESGSCSLRDSAELELRLLLEYAKSLIKRVPGLNGVLAPVIEIGPEALERGLDANQQHVDHVHDVVGGDQPDFR
jgi:hypothetical protein